jgi:hypothetical protein
MAKEKSTSKEKRPDEKEHWKSEPDEHDYPAAASYLSLVMSEAAAHKVVEALKVAPVEHRFAKDLLRASQLDLLPADNFHVVEDLKKVRRQEKLSPVLLVRGALARGGPLVIADGYHRICASYHLNENAPIPCRITAPPGTRQPKS